jgi:two-component system, sensor histidine kinase FlrB
MAAAPLLSVPRTGRRELTSAQPAHRADSCDAPLRFVGTAAPRVLPPSAAQARDPGQPPLALAALTALPSGVVVLDEQGTVQFANPAATQMLGGPVDGLLWREVITQAFLIEAGVGGDEIGLRDGRHVSISTCPLGGRPGQILHLHDVTETRKLRERVKRNERLTALGEVSAALSHQIRTPLSAALLYSAQLGDDDLGEADRGRFSNRLGAALMNIETLVRDMLLFVRGEVLGSERVAVAALLARLPRALETQLDRFRADLDIGTAQASAVILGNADALLSVLQNLIMNALEAGATQVSVGTLETGSSDGCIRFEVHDDGPGIDTEVSGHVFDAFFTTRAGGTGLGLAVARNVVRAHGGDIEMESAPGAGCRFIIRLPLAGSPDMSNPVACDGAAVPAGTKGAAA